MTLNILLAEDRVLQRESWKMILERRGYSVVIAKDGKEALDRMTPDIGFIITGMNMGGYNGDWLISSLAERGYNTPIVVHSASSIRKDQLPSYNGPVEVVEKNAVDQNLIDILGYVVKYTGVEPKVLGL